MARSLVLLLSLVGAVFAAPPIPPNDSCPSDYPEDFGFDAEDIITRDVCILGGGATGTYAGVRMKDMEQSFVIIERNDRLGGHAETLYADGRYPIDYGAANYIDSNITRSFFGRFGVELTPAASSPFQNALVDLETGMRLINNNASAVNSTNALLAYAGVLSQYPFLLDGAYNLPEPVPEDLLLPFGAFVEKYQIQDAVPVIWIFASGVGNLFEATTLYVVQNFGLPHLMALQNNGFLRVPEGAAKVYTEAAHFLGTDVLYNSCVIETHRSDSGVSVIVETSGGVRKLIKAKKLLVTIPPTVQSLQGFDLDQQEMAVFDQWKFVSYYVAVLNQTGIPDGVNVVNVDPTQPASLPRTPFIWQLDYVGVPGYLTAKVIGDESFSEEAAKSLLTDSVVRMGTAGTFPTLKPEFAAFGVHKPLQLSVSTDAIEAGFYRNLYALQGHQSTLYTGLAWCSDYSPLLWGYTEQLLPQLIS